MPAFLLADADAGGIVAVGAEGRRAARADPFVAALMTALLLGEALFQLLHDLVPTAKRLDPGLVFVAQVEFGDAAQPFLRDFGDAGVGQRFEALEDMAEDLIEAVEVALVLHERRAREVVEIFDAAIGDAGAHGVEQRQVFLERDGELRVAKLGEEGREHPPTIGRAASAAERQFGGVGARHSQRRSCAQSKEAALSGGFLIAVTDRIRS